jgi:hypothetical protein
MSGGLIGGGVVTGVAQVAEIAEGMRSMPRSPIVVDRVLGLGLVAILARGCLGAALGAFFKRMSASSKEF